MKKLLSEKEIGANLLLVIEKKGDTQDSFGKRIKTEERSIHVVVCSNHRGHEDPG